MARDLAFGISVTPYAATYPQIVEQVLVAEAGGLDLVGIQDHLYQRRFLDTFSLLADLLARTSRLRFFPDVANLPLRSPPMIAKAAASMDVMSGGRFELGLGSGTFWDAVAGMGGPRRRPGEAFMALERSRSSDPRSTVNGLRVGMASTTRFPATHPVRRRRTGSGSGLACTDREACDWPAAPPTAGSRRSATWVPRRSRARRRPSTKRP